MQNMYLYVSISLMKIRIECYQALLQLTVLQSLRTMLSTDETTVKFINLTIVVVDYLPFVKQIYEQLRKSS